MDGICGPGHWNDTDMLVVGQWLGPSSMLRDSRQTNNTPFEPVGVAGSAALDWLRSRADG